MDSTNIITYGLAAIVGFFVLRAFYRGTQGRKMLKERLTREYRTALKGRDRQKALNAGRAYYSFHRGNNELAPIDEQSIANDMKMMPSEKVTVEVEPSGNTIDQLERLAKLKEKGILTESEFLEQKEKILRANTQL